MNADKHSALAADVELPAVRGINHGYPLASRARARRLARCLGAVSVLVLGCLFWNQDWLQVQDLKKLLAGYDYASSQGSMEEFDWSMIVPSETLKWHPCLGKFQCARLAVPLDYTQPDGEKAALALAKYPAAVPTTSKKYRGPILFNPGGPGLSGVELITAPGQAESYQKMIGDEYDYISWDPRGVGFTTPPVRTFNDIEEEAWNMRLSRLGDANASADALGRQYALAQLLGKVSYDRTRHAAEHVGTPVSARDMLTIMRAHGREKLQYWGYSYGTVLGATFAAMFPDHVERILLDGVVDSENFEETLWDNNLLDVEAELMHVYQTCVDAGPTLCPLYEATPTAIDHRVNQLIANLQHVPLSYYDPTTGAYDTIDGGDVKKTLFLTLFKPHFLARGTFAAFADLERGDATAMSKIYSRAGWNERMRMGCQSDGESRCSGQKRKGMVKGGAEIQFAIACGEGKEVRDGVPELRGYFQRMLEGAPSFAGLWPMRVFCSGWKVRAKEYFHGPFVGNTSHPILLVSSILDPVTPRRHAYKMSKGFKDSVVLTQNSSGHGLLSAPSLCTAKHIRAYFRHGVLPANDTVCQVEGSIFGLGDGDGSSLTSKGMSKDDRKLLEASRMLFEKYVPPMIGLV